jgi:hypothetical protein
LGGSLLTSLEVKDLGVVFALVGATGATIVSFTLPGAAYYAMHAPSSQRDSDLNVLYEGGSKGVPGPFSDREVKLVGSLGGGGEGPVWKLYGSAALVVTGCILTPVCLVFIFI